LLVFYFSGHGMSHNGKDYLLPIKASPYALSETGIKVETLVEKLAATGCKNIVMFIDACREATDGAKSIGLEDTRNAVERAGIVTFFSCDSKDKSYEIDQLQH